MRKINNQQEQLKKDSIREQNRLRQQKAREQKRKSARKLTEESVTVEKKKTSFSSKMQKSRMKSKLKQIISESSTRTRKAELLISLANSPQTKNAIQNNSLNTSLNASLSESDATDREIVESLKETYSVIKSKSQSMNKDLLNSYQLGVAASCSRLYQNVRQQNDWELALPW